MLTSITRPSTLWAYFLTEEFIPISRTCLHGFGLGAVRPIFLVVELDQPVTVVLNDKIAGLGHS